MNTKQLAKLVDQYWLVREDRLALQKQIDAGKEEEQKLKNILLDELQKCDASGVAGGMARATIVKKSVPTVQDWDQLYQYIKKTNSFDLLQRRLSNTAVEERWNDEKQVPGVGLYVDMSVSVVKVK